MTAFMTLKQIKIHSFKYSFHLSLSQYRTNLSGTRNFFADYNSPVCTDLINAVIFVFLGGEYFLRNQELPFLRFHEITAAITVFDERH